MELSGLAAHSSTRGRRPRGPAVLAAALVLATIAAAAVQARTIADNTPAATREAEDLGPANASETISVTLWLQAPGSEAAAEQLVRELYDQSSPRFHRWLSEPEANALLAPSAAQANRVQKYLTEHGLRVVAVDEGRLYVRAQGTIADGQNAFHAAVRVRARRRGSDGGHRRCHRLADHCRRRGDLLPGLRTAGSDGGEFQGVLPARPSVDLRSGLGGRDLARRRMGAFGRAGRQHRARDRSDRQRFGPAGGDPLRHPPPSRKRDLQQLGRGRIG